ncbi:PaaI family thioesterase [Candidatus Macondimonas diazotrophica]|jgi:uncharacterized protein (TIGR00369 family)|uniref:PaaI family thioesterase n=1 Tax=Candidatus Macondimonas diazotrophica TaxID=2305248 RepID=A0A4Z0FAQ3_9GAMM|nr:PaaI family thioesterase [Candidatus Macondimonas diazotrophica]MDY6956057.1 PaaI family thioesterase [Pseudomonadota bacterium]HBG31331.1 PaaI family thioesterase [Gammaproteobacteria bacterium]NCU00688.1 PaaI family thioesterase [Candidatus Macondimonas diazotrophica]TFZ83522.1 PaaI family thioesterase [Candidatus Macondimonas diazotrophica]HBG51902.1 PaaI family thioesterase [Gammaproteobacteria bacterium]
MSDETSLFERDPDQVRRLHGGFFNAIPHSKELGLEVVDMGPGWGILKVPYRPELVGNPKTGVLHGGVLTSLIDSTCGLAVFCRLPRMEAIATLDLRLDFLKPAVTGEDLFARAECYRLTRQIAFVRATAYQRNADDLVATSVATFMRSSSNPKRPFPPREGQ